MVSASGFKTRWLFGAVVTVSGFLGSVSVGQTLDQVRNEIRSPDPAAAPRESERDRKRREKEEKRRKKRESTSYLGASYTEDDDDETLGETLGSFGWQLTGAVTQAVFVGDPNRHGFDINYEVEPATPAEVPQEPVYVEGATMYFSHYPYADGFDGYTMQSDYVPARPLTAATQFQLLFGSDFDSIQWYTGKGLFEWSRSRFGFDAEWTYFRENLGSGRHDELHIGDVNLLWRRVQTPRWMLRWGLGAVWAHDRLGTEAGVNGTVKVDFFPRRPWVVSGEYDLGLLDNATAQHLQLGVGATWNHLELFSAYDYRRFDDVDIAGPVFGIRLWW